MIVLFKRSALLVGLLGLTCSNAAWAGDSPKTVVELFTSQGCSSCPPANKFVGSLSEDEDTLVLTYGVTYWDYLGWKDTFGKTEFTKRQRAYAQGFGIGNVYTPQIVLNGSAHSPRYQREDVYSMPLSYDAGAFDLQAENGKLSLESRAPVVIVSFAPGWQSVDVTKGENHGRTLRLANVVKAVHHLDADEVADIEIDEALAYAALLHDPETRRVQAVSVYRPQK
ncbi:MAG: DUF1223 domain-containing protein [Maricaulaceae bacterium]